MLKQTIVKNKICNPKQCQQSLFSKRLFTLYYEIKRGNKTFNHHFTNQKPCKASISVREIVVRVFMRATYYSPDLFIIKFLKLINSSIKDNHKFKVPTLFTKYSRYIENAENRLVHLIDKSNNSMHRKQSQIKHANIVPKIHILNAFRNTGLKKNILKK